MRSTVVFATVLVASFVAARGTVAEPAAEERPTYKAILEQGYEVKAIVFLPADVSTRISGSAQQDTVSVTLQKGNQTATCWTTFVAWNRHNVTTIPCNTLK